MSRRTVKWAAWSGSLILALGGASTAQEVEPVEEPPTHPIENPDHAREHGLESLKSFVESEGLPLPSNLKWFVRDRDKAIALGKALFWDMQVGSDGVQACASCHFHGGADSRAKNQLNPNGARVEDDHQGRVKGYHFAAGAPDDLFEIVSGSPSTKGPNYELVREDFPFVTEPNEWVRNGDVIDPYTPDNSNDVASSQGVFLTQFDGVNETAVDDGTRLDDPIFNVDGVVLRRVEPRNTPSTYNAVFNFFNFWDGRANPKFNGNNPFGKWEKGDFVFIRVGKTGSEREHVRVWPGVLKLSSLASQAVGPPGSDFEMSHAGRNWLDIGEKMVDKQPLALQMVASDDSVLGPYKADGGPGLKGKYRDLIKKAFRKNLWNYTKDVEIDGRSLDQMEANFSFFFGVSVMLYESTLVTDESPFDKWMEGSGEFVDGFGQDELDGLNAFTGSGKCINCHSGPEFTNASVRNNQKGNNVIEAMVMGDRKNALYDNGFYNIAVTPTTDDIGRGGRYPDGSPLASSRQTLFQRLGIQKMDAPIIGHRRIPAVSEEGEVVCTDADENGFCDDGATIQPRFQRAAVDGAFKTPTIRNTVLTGPYFHNGSAATLKQVVQFYDRGGNFCKFNLRDLDPDIRRLGLTDDEEDDLVRFMVATTDSRTLFKKAPFDHPQLMIPNGHPGDENAISATNTADGITQADDDLLVLDAVGRHGTADPLETFLGLDPQDAIFTPTDSRNCDEKPQRGGGGRKDR